MDAEADRGLAPATYNGLLKILKCCFRETGSKVFDKIALMPGGQIHRIPYTLEELEQIRVAAETDKFIRPVIIIAMCTGMRLGDCCNLKWSDIDEEEGIVRVKTGKTGAAVVIPIFDWLKEELDRQEGLPNSEYVIPRQRWKYMADASHLTKRLRKILAKIGFGEPASNYRLKTEDVDEYAVNTKVQEYLDTLPDTKKTKRMGKVYSAYMNGQAVDQISEELSVSKSTASLYLNEIEDKTSTSFIRGKSRETTKTEEDRKPVQM
jgi:integrase